MPIVLPPAIAAAAASMGMTAETFALLVGGLSFLSLGAIGTKLAQDNARKPSHGYDPGPEPDAKPGLPIPYIPTGRDDEQKTCQAQLKDRYDQDKVGALSRFAGRFESLPEADRQVVLKHLCETEAKKGVGNVATNLDDFWSDPRMVNMLHALHDTPGSRQR